MKVLLVCAAGMSTSMLMKKMEAYAKDNGIDLEIAARSFSELKDPADDGYDCILIGPQISYQKDKVVAKAQGPARRRHPHEGLRTPELPGDLRADRQDPGVGQHR